MFRFKKITSIMEVHDLDLNILLEKIIVRCYQNDGKVLSNEEIERMISELEKSKIMV